MEPTQETVAVVQGEFVVGAGECVELDDLGLVVQRQAYRSENVFWQCPHCGESHHFGLYADPLERTGPRSSPELSGCEHGIQVVLVEW